MWCMWIGWCGDCLKLCVGGKFAFGLFYVEVGYDFFWIIEDGGEFGCVVKIFDYFVYVCVCDFVIVEDLCVFVGEEVGDAGV